MEVEMLDDLLETQILKRFFEVEKPFPSKAAAQAFLKFQLAAEDKERLAELAAKARAGRLSPEDQAAINIYARVGSWLSILKIKARRTLAAPPKAKTNRKTPKAGSRS
jgi:hypothetical protein